MDGCHFSGPFCGVVVDCTAEDWEMPCRGMRDGNTCVCLWVRAAVCSIVIFVYARVCLIGCCEMGKKSSNFTFVFSCFFPFVLFRGRSFVVWYVFCAFCGR